MSLCTLTVREGQKVKCSVPEVVHPFVPATPQYPCFTYSPLTLHHVTIWLFSDSDSLSFPLRFSESHVCEVTMRRHRGKFIIQYSIFRLTEFEKCTRLALQPSVCHAGLLSGYCVLYHALGACSILIGCGVCSLLNKTFCHITLKTPMDATRFFKWETNSPFSCLLWKILTAKLTLKH